ncbi:MAG: histidinol dehydrogenase, partial [Kiritimatiellaeota bacterium]|nr:histidinol dehydrogenase [Kiritimatiellota bacterium]
IPTLAWSAAKPAPAVEAFLNRPAFDPVAEKTAAKILRDIRARGMDAVLDAVKKFQGASLDASALRVENAALVASGKDLPQKTRAAIKHSHANIRAFAKAGMRCGWTQKTPGGGFLGEKFSPLDRVGIYVPGGTAPLVSSALMTATLASVAGVPEIIACTPCAPDGSIAPALLFALHTAGATEVCKAGGIQAIGLMAFGVEGFAPVQKICGPGNAFVTAAKRQVFGHVAIDQVAGPSEIAIIADADANPEWVAADLLSQAEHGSGHEKSLLITTCDKLARAACDAFIRQATMLSRRAMIAKTVANGGVLIVRVPSLADAATLANRFAAEHLEVMVKNPKSLLPRLHTAGAIFLGPWTPEAAGDFTAGPSHVLPTGGAARMFSGLTADDFRRRSSLVHYTQNDLARDLPAIQTFGTLEGLDAHKRSAEIRFETK